MYAKLCPSPLALAVSDKAFYDFSNQWLAGLQPQLSLETGRYGQIRISSQVVPVLNLSSIATALAIMDSLRREAAREVAAEKTVEKENDALPSDEIDAAQSPPNYSQVDVAEALPANLQPVISMTRTAARVCRSVVDELCPDGVYHAAGEAVHLPPLSPAWPTVP